MRCILLLMALLVVAVSASAQDVPAGEPTVAEVADGIYVLRWAGGNIGISVGDDGVVLIDDQYAPMVPRNIEALREITDKPLRFVLNTHWHGDHTGGNEALAGEGALVIAHDNVRKRLAEGMLLREIPPATGEALPVVTFDRSGSALSSLGPPAPATSSEPGRLTPTLTSNVAGSIRESAPSPSSA